MMQHLMNAIKSTAQWTTQGIAPTKQGVVTSYDPNHYAVQVQLQPDDVNTGWIPLKCAWVGNGWGLFCPPSIGDVVEVDFQEGDGSVPSAGWRFYNDLNRPLPCPSGEFWLVHQKGAQLKFCNDGTVELKAVKDLNVTAGGDLNLNVAGTLNSRASQWNHNGPVKITGDMVINGAAQVTGTLTGQAGMAVSGGSGAILTGDMVIRSGDVTVDGVSLKHHTHPGVQPGGSNTGQPQ